MKSYLSQLIVRFGSETPIFFKKILYFGISVGGTGASLLAAQAAPGVTLPAALIKIAGYMFTAGIVCAAVAKTATTNPNLQAQGGSNVVVNNNTTPPGESTEAAKSPPLP